MNTAEKNYCLLQEIEANRSFMLMAYRQNPALLERAEARIKQLFESESHRQCDVSAATCSNHVVQSAIRNTQSGTSLIELIMFIVIVSLALAGLLQVLNVTTKNSADPLVRKQAMAAAYSLLEEVELQDYFPTGATAAVTQANRASAHHIVSDYHGFAASGVYPVTGNVPVAGLENYNVTVTVIPEVAVWNGIPAGSAVQINVTVTSPMGEAITATGYRTAY